MAKRKTTVVRRTVSLPEEIDRRMEKHVGVNWSEVARSAFEGKLNELDKKKDLKGMQAIINRLRETKVQATNDSRDIGEQAGKQWAEEYATAMELQRLESLRDHLGTFDDFLTRPDASNDLAKIILGEQVSSQISTDLFWDENYGDSDEHVAWRQSDGFAFGFATGALRVWNQVKGSL
jgi:hypothetical protein